jgi:hypothetical protein
MIAASDAIHAASAVLGLEPGDIVGHCRDHATRLGRRIAARLMRDEAGMGLHEIATALACRSHSTIVRISRSPVDPIVLEHARTFARRRARGRRDIGAVWAQPAVPASWLAASRQVLERASRPRGIRRMVRKKVGS